MGALNCSLTANYGDIRDALGQRWSMHDHCKSPDDGSPSCIPHIRPQRAQVGSPMPVPVEQFGFAQTVLPDRHRMSPLASVYELVHRFSMPRCNVTLPKRFCFSLPLVRFQSPLIDRGTAAPSFGIGTSFVRFVHDPLSLGAIHSRELPMQLHRQAIAALVFLDQAHQCPHGGILDRCAELLGRIAQGPVVTGGMGPRKQQLRVGTAFLDAFLQRIPQRNQPVRCLNGARTSTLGIRLRREQCFHNAGLWISAVGSVFSLSHHYLPTILAQSPNQPSESFYWSFSWRSVPTQGNIRRKKHGPQCVCDHLKKTPAASRMAIRQGQLHHTANELDQFPVLLRSAASSPGFPSLEHSESGSLPADDGLGAEEHQGGSPFRPNALEHPPQISVPRAKLRPVPPTFEHGDLVAQSQNFHCQFVLGSE